MAFFGYKICFQVTEQYFKEIYIDKKSPKSHIELSNKVKSQFEI